jgi:hypothetical protein
MRQPENMHLGRCNFHFVHLIFHHLFLYPPLAIFLLPAPNIAQLLPLPRRKLVMKDMHWLEKCFLAGIYLAIFGAPLLLLPQHKPLSPLSPPHLFTLLQLASKLFSSCFKTTIESSFLSPCFELITIQFGKKQVVVSVACSTCNLIHALWLSS